MPEHLISYLSPLLAYSSMHTGAAGALAIGVVAAWSWRDSSPAELSGGEECVAY